MIPILLFSIFAACGTEAEPDFEPPSTQPEPEPIADTRAQYSVTLTLSDDIRQIELRFGQHSNPTTQDEQMPPAPPDGTLHAHFTRGDKNYWRDFRSEDSEAEEWDFSFQTGANGTVVLEWNVQTTRFPGTLSLINPSDDSSVDMDGSGEIELPASSTGSLLFEYLLDE